MDADTSIGSSDMDLGLDKIGSALFGGTSLLGTALGMGGQLLGMEWASDEADANRNFQMNMSNTAYQRQVADLRAAGLNPMLGYMKGVGGSTTPPGSTPPSPPNVGGMDVATAAQLKVLDAQVRNIDADTEKKKQETTVGQYDVEVKKATTGLLIQQALSTENARNLTDAETELVIERIVNAVKEGKRIDAHTGNIKIDTMLRELDYQEAYNKAAAQEKYRWYFQNVAPFTGDASRLIRSIPNRNTREQYFDQRGPRHTTINRGE